MPKSTRKKVVLTIKQKLELIEKFEGGKSVPKLAEEYGIGYQTVRDIVKQKQKFEEYAWGCDSDSAPSKRKSLKKSSFKDLDAAVLKWFNQKRAEGVSVTSAMCINKAKLFHSALGLEGSFNASTGWLTRFKQRHGIRELSTQEQGECADSIKKFCAEFKEYMRTEELSLEQIYNADETGLYWKCLPAKTLVPFEETSNKSHKERVTVMCCANVTGSHKMKLVLIGKEEKPRSFTVTDAKNLPVDYYSQKGAWMDRAIFEDWFKYRWVPEVREFLKSKGSPEKAVLLIDSAPCHPNENVLRSDDGCFRVKFLPLNIALIIQPMNLGIISTLKRDYRMGLLRTLSNEDQEFWKQMTILDAIYGLTQAWNKAESATFIQSWKKILPGIEKKSPNSNKPETDSELNELVTDLQNFENIDKVTIEHWLEQDSCEPGFQCITEADIILSISQPEDEKDIDVSEDENVVNRISHEAALFSVENLLKYVDQWRFEYNDIIALKKIQTDIKKRLRREQMQSKIANLLHNQ